MKYPIFVMYILFLLTLLKAMTSVSVSQKPGICSNVSNGEPLECCPNYQRVGTSCEECLHGFHGKNCAEDCAEGFYGRLCGEKCSCDPCDKVSGCQNVPKEYPFSTTADTQNDDAIPEIFRYNQFQRLSKVEESSTASKEKDLFLTTKENRKEDFQDAYGHIDPMDGCYNILKLKVLDEKDDVCLSKSFSTPQIKNTYMKAENVVSATTSTVSNSIIADELTSEKLVKREKMKNQKDIFQTLNRFKQKDINERKILRYSFVKSPGVI